MSKKQKNLVLLAGASLLAVATGCGAGIGGRQAGSALDTRGHTNFDMKYFCDVPVTYRPPVAGTEDLKDDPLAQNALRVHGNMACDRINVGLAALQASYSRCEESAMRASYNSKGKRYTDDYMSCTARAETVFEGVIAQANRRYDMEELRVRANIARTEERLGVQTAREQKTAEEKQKKEAEQQAVASKRDAQWTQADNARYPGIDLTYEQKILTISGVGPVTRDVQYREDLDRLSEDHQKKVESQLLKTQAGVERCRAQFEASANSQRGDAYAAARTEKECIQKNESTFKTAAARLETDLDKGVQGLQKKYDGFYNPLVDLVAQYNRTTLVSSMGYNDFLISAVQSCAAEEDRVRAASISNARSRERLSPDLVKACTHIRKQPISP